MKSIIWNIIIFALFLSNYGISGKPDSVNVKGGLDLKEAIEKFIKDLQFRMPEMFTFADKNFTVPKNDYFLGTINFSNISLSGLKEFNATILYRSILPLPKAFFVSLEKLCLNFKYKSDITVYNSKYLSLFGEGDASLSLKNLIFDGNVSVSILPVNATTDADIDLDNVSVNITGLLNDDNFSRDIGNLLSKSMTKLFDANKSYLSKALTNTLNFIMQEIIKHRNYFKEDNYYHMTEGDLLGISQNLLDNSIN